MCQDGVRKKAKYLHDAPNEALLPGAANHYTHGDLRRNDSTASNETSPQTTFFQPNRSYSAYNPGTQMPPPSLHERNLSSTSFGQPSPATSAFNVSNSQPLQSPTVSQEQSSLPSTGWGSTLFDPSDPSVYNFDTASMNFGNHYGALEFGMLGQMATGVNETPDSESGTQRGSVSQYQMPLGSFSDSPNQHQYGFGNDSVMTSDWVNGSNMYSHVPPKGPNAFAIETNPAHFTSPENTNTPPDGMKHEDSPVMTSGVRPTSSDIQGTYLDMTQSNRVSRLPPISTPQLKARSLLPTKPLKRPRDPTSIYTSVTSPYPYTAGFHQLIAYLQRRFANHPSKTLAIAKSLASIRPSFIATTKTLNREDLIFMEKCFQRTLWEYEGFIEGVGTPTIVARRTGEIAAVGKEFQILTGWKKDVLLGRAPNLNVNRGHSGKTPGESGANSAGRLTGQTTPLRQLTESEESSRQHVFLAELLDDDSIVQFYEDFARLAFGDSRGSVMGKGKLLKYRTKDDEISANLKAEAEARGESETTNRPDAKRTDSFALTRPQDAKKGISGEKGMQRLGSSDGKVDCAYCWTVKRDVFDIPMLIVMNVSTSSYFRDSELLTTGIVPAVYIATFEDTICIHDALGTCIIQRRST